MYKQVGFQFDRLSPEQVESLRYTVLAIEEFLRSTDRSEMISKQTDKRSASRVRIPDDLPDDLKLSIWIMFGNRFRKCPIKDIPFAGAAVILPFNDQFDSLNIDRPVTCLVDFGTAEGFINQVSTIIFKSVIRYCKTIDPTEQLKDTLAAVNQEVHSIDKEFIPSSRLSPSTVRYKNGKIVEQQVITAKPIEQIDFDFDLDQFDIHIEE